ncbi:hypothetical protein AWB97_01075 [Mycobacterium intracellulare subsp. chimaera]|nr:hypothetical protein AWB97_01075 [Mycobacterium intracellulare subsp. chimaera]
MCGSVFDFSDGVASELARRPERGSSITQLLREGRINKLVSRGDPSCFQCRRGRFNAFLGGGHLHFSGGY